MSDHSEEKIHRRVVAELRLTFRRKGFKAGEEPFFHCPNEGKRAPRYRAKLAALGVSPGVPDLLVVHPVVEDGTVYQGAALELKKLTGTASAAQTRWLGVWQAAGFWAGVVRGMDEARDTLLRLGLIDQNQRLHFR
ncbi:MAG: hypothetical protein VYA51_12855 [Planctomycetota bacterium]|nr:hypothetical protein [Planctomycetota bacterium]